MSTIRKQFIFLNEEDLGKVVSKATPFSMIQSNKPSPSPDEIMGVLGNPRFPGMVGHLWSKLFGFNFVSTIEDEFPHFSFVYCPKLRGNFSKSDKGLSGWYIWLIVSPKVYKVLSPLDAYGVYGFNVNKFVLSDLFKKWTPVIVAGILTSLDNLIALMVLKYTASKTLSGKLLTELNFYISAIRRSLSRVFEVVDFVEVYDSEGNVVGRLLKMAYNGNKSYALNGSHLPTDKTIASQLKNASKTLIVSH